MYTDYLSIKIKRRKIFIAVFVTIVVVFPIVLICTQSYSLGQFYKTVYLEDASCHYSTDGDALPKIDEKFFPFTNSIFFHETSCLGRLNSRQACAIESAARTHTEWEIHVLFSAPVNKLGLGDVNIELLKLMKNVFFTRVHLEDDAKGTPLETLVKSGAIKRTLWPIRHTKDVLKYLTLYKWGGVVLDFDTIVTQPLGVLGRNWAIIEDSDYVRSEAIAFYRDSAGTLIADTAARTLVRNFDVIWGRYLGNRVITDALKEVCITNSVTKMTADDCLDFVVLPPSALLPLDLSKEEGFYKESDYNSTDIYIYLFKNEPIRDDKVNYKGSIYAKLAKRYCPIIYENYRDLFGT